MTNNGLTALVIAFGYGCLISNNVSGASVALVAAGVLLLWRWWSA